MPQPSPQRPKLDELLPRITFEQAAAYYGVVLEHVRQIGHELRTRCFLHCGKTEETGDRALAINVKTPQFWKCREYGCAKSGNLVGLCDLMKPGVNMNGKPKGDRFKAILHDLQAMVAGETALQASQRAKPTTPAPEAPREEPPTRNVPLACSENERARQLVHLDDKFVVDANDMHPAAARYVRTRPYMTPEVLRKWRVGYLSRNSGGDNAGGTMRGKIVYPMLSESGDELTWFGRDPQYEEKHARWIAGGKQDKEPDKTRFVKGFHRGQELFGQHASRLKEPGYRERLAELGVLVVEGPNDVIALDGLGQPAVGLCSNTVTQPQAAKIARWAKRLGNHRVVLMLDCDEAGENGAKQAIWTIAQHMVDVRLAWSRTMSNGVFNGKQPESLSGEEWSELRSQLVR